MAKLCGAVLVSDYLSPLSASAAYFFLNNYRLILE